MMATRPQGDPCIASSRSAVSVDSFATNPMVGATPAMDATEMNAAVAMTGACRPTPLSSLMSRVESCLSITPTMRNSADLNSACPITRARPARALACVP